MRKQSNGKNTVDNDGKITDVLRMIEIAHLLKLADAFQAIEPISDTTLSFRIFRDSKKLAALRTGSDITTGRFNDALSWFSDNWPVEAVWPPSITRPEPRPTDTAARDAVEQTGEAA